jgi:hypothetical protein
MDNVINRLIQSNLSTTGKSQFTIHFSSFANYYPSVVAISFALSQIDDIERLPLYNRHIKTQLLP